MSFKSFNIIQGFIKEVFDHNLLDDPVDERIKQISLLMNARWAMIQMMEKKHKVFAKEFMKYVFPILEVTVH